MKRKRIKPDEPIRIELSERDRVLLLDHTLADPEYANRLQSVPGKKHLVGAFTLDDLEDILGYIAAEANSTKSKKLQPELDDLYERLTEIQESYDDGMWQGDEN
jgi:hypothetical protein